MLLGFKMGCKEIFSMNETLVRRYYICPLAKEDSICDGWKDKEAFDHYCSKKNGNLCSVSYTEIK